MRRVNLVLRVRNVMEILLVFPATQSHDKFPVIKSDNVGQFFFLVSVSAAAGFGLQKESRIFIAPLFLTE